MLWFSPLPTSPPPFLYPAIFFLEWICPASNQCYLSLIVLFDDIILFLIYVWHSWEENASYLSIAFARRRNRVSSGTDRLPPPQAVLFFSRVYQSGKWENSLKFTPTKRRLSASHLPTLEPLLKPALSSYTINSNSLAPFHPWNFMGFLPPTWAPRGSAIQVFVVTTSNMSCCLFPVGCTVCGFTSSHGP